MVTTSLPNDPRTAQNPIAHASPIFRHANPAAQTALNSAAHVESPPKKKPSPTPPVL